MHTCGTSHTGALRWQPISDSRAIGWVMAYALGRVVMEEFVFRALMLPHPKVRRGKSNLT